MNPLRAKRSRWYEPLEPRVLLAASNTVASLLQNGELAFDNYLPASYELSVSGGFLTGPSRSKPLTVALNYLSNHAKSLGLSPADVGSPIVTNQYTDSLTGLTHIYLQQKFNDLAVVNATLSINVTRRGQI